MHKEAEFSKKSTLLCTQYFDSLCAVHFCAYKDYHESPASIIMKELLLSNLFYRNCIGACGVDEKLNVGLLEAVLPH